MKKLCLFLGLIFQGFSIFMLNIVRLVLQPAQADGFFRTIGHAIIDYDQIKREAKIEKKSLEQLYPGIAQQSVVLADVERADGNLALSELYVICALARHLSIHTAIEFGTFNGLVAAHLARNTPNEVSIVTIDLRPEDLAGLSSPLARDEENYVNKSLIGEKILRLSSAEQNRVKQLYGYSTKMDLSIYYGKMDLVFVDASHAYEYVKHDSEEAFKLCSSQGVILWHDYLSWKGVTRYLNELNSRYPLTHLSGTALVLYQNGK